MKTLILVAVLGVSSLGLASEPLFTAKSPDINPKLVATVNANSEAIFTALSRQEEGCIDLHRGSCSGHYEDVYRWSEAERKTVPAKKFHGYCTVGGNRCDINTDAGWSFFFEGNESTFKLLKIYNTYNEL